MPPRWFLIALALASAACRGGSADRGRASAVAGPITITIVGTNDLHGHVHALPIFGGFLRVLREDRTRDVLLVDAGDMFQGTLESNLGEGAAVVAAYNRLRYDAAAVGNHEFDFGPVGPAATAKEGEDARGALRARAAEAKFPFLLSNVVDASTSRAPAWQNVVPSAIVRKAGVAIGVIGATSEDTPRTTIAANFAGLAVRPIAETLAREAAALRAQGATVVVAVTHAGGTCKDVEHPPDAATCDSDGEIMRVLAQLPAGSVDALVAGHTHHGMAAVVAGVPVIESFCYGKAFGRIDLTIDPVTKRVTSSRIAPPVELALPATYEGHAVAADPEIDAELAPCRERARTLKQQPIGVILDGPIGREYDRESPEGNLFTDLLRASVPGADVAIVTAGGLRADLRAGPLAYEGLFEAMPFDNRVAVVRIRGRDLRAILADSLRRKTGFVSISGLTVTAACRAGRLDVKIERAGKRAVGDDEPLELVTSDFLATGGDGVVLPKEAVTIGDTLVRDALASGLRARGGHLRADDPSMFDSAHPRIRIDGVRPLTCDDASK